jgi:hypothetical protein
MRKSSRQVLGTSIATIATTPNGRLNNIATSSRLTVISPTGKRNECVSSRHRSRNAREAVVLRAGLF